MVVPVSEYICGGRGLDCRWLVGFLGWRMGRLAGEEVGICEFGEELPHFLFFLGLWDYDSSEHEYNIKKVEVWLDYYRVRSRYELL